MKIYIKSVIDLEKNPIVTVHYSYYHGILPFKEIEVGQKWISSGGHIVTVTRISEDEWVSYEQGGGAPPHEKHHFAFQCRYCLLSEYYKKDSYESIK